MLKKILFILILLSVPVFGATIQGKVYDFDLELVKNVVVEIDSQRMVTQESSYMFDLPAGEYTIIAKKKPNSPEEEVTKEKVTIKEGEKKTLDLFLFPSTELDEDLIEELPNVDATPLKKTVYEGPSIINYIILGIVILIIILILKNRNQNTKNGKPEVNVKKETIIVSDEFNAKLLLILKDEGGRASQKTLRKKLGLSEAKVSMMVAQLESEGKVKKIKQGRANIVVLN